jgi:hypothetical protein
MLWLVADEPCTSTTEPRSGLPAYVRYASEVPSRATNRRGDGTVLYSALLKTCEMLSLVTGVLGPPPAIAPRRPGAARPRPPRRSTFRPSCSPHRCQKASVAQPFGKRFELSRGIWRMSAVLVQPQFARPVPWGAARTEPSSIARKDSPSAWSRSTSGLSSTTGKSSHGRVRGAFGFQAPCRPARCGDIIRHRPKISNAIPDQHRAH